MVRGRAGTRCPAPRLPLAGQLGRGSQGALGSPEAGGEGVELGVPYAGQIGEGRGVAAQVFVTEHRADLRTVRDAGADKQLIRYNPRLCGQISFFRYF